MKMKLRVLATLTAVALGVLPLFSSCSPAKTVSDRRPSQVEPVISGGEVGNTGGEVGNTGNGSLQRVLSSDPLTTRSDGSVLIFWPKIGYYGGMWVISGDPGSLVGACVAFGYSTLVESDQVQVDRGNSAVILDPAGDVVETRYGELHDTWKYLRSIRCKGRIGPELGSVPASPPGAHPPEPFSTVQTNSDGTHTIVDPLFYFGGRYRPICLPLNYYEGHIQEREGEAVCDLFGFKKFTDVMYVEERLVGYSQQCIYLRKNKRSEPLKYKESRMPVIRSVGCRKSKK